MSLIDDQTDDFTEKCRQALTEIFQRFDLDKDGSLNEAELDAYAMVCNEKVLSQEEKGEIKTYFKLDEKGNLTLEGFLDMYHMQTSADPKETWKDLRKFGYDKKLNKVIRMKYVLIN